MGPSLHEDIAAFGRARERARQAGAARVAIQLALGMDLETLLRARGPRRAALVGRLARKVRRERNRGLARRSDYDLDRHIALGRVLTRLKQGADPDGAPPFAGDRASVPGH